VILLVIILIVFLTRYAVPVQKVSIEELPEDDEVSELPRVDRAIADSQSQQVRTVYPARRQSKQIPVLDLNKCDSSDLELLPGIGPVLASRIVRYRNLLGGYASIYQLREVYGLPEETYNAISRYISADPADISRINVNTAGFRELIRLPYLDRSDVNGILRYREFSGRIKGMDELVNNKIISGETALKAAPYLDFGP